MCTLCFALIKGCFTFLRFEVPLELPPDIQIALHLGRVAKKLILKTWQSASPLAFVHGIKSQNQRTVQSQGKLTGDDGPLFQASHITAREQQ